MPDGTDHPPLAASGFPSGEEIGQELERVLSSPAFEATPKMRRFLQFVVEMTVAGRADELKGYTIGTEVYGRTANFNPAEDTVVRIQAGRLRRALEVYYLTEGKNDPVRIAIPKGTYVPDFSVTSAPDAPPFAEERDDAIALPSLAVLPFVNLMGDPARDFFAAGFTEELIAELAHYEDVRVIGYLAEPQPTRTTEPAVSPEQTGAHYVLEGSLRMAGEQMKVSVKLTDVRTREVVWADQYRRVLTAANLVELQESISEQIVGRIAGEYGIIPERLSQKSRKKAPKELTTYEAILRYYYFQIVFSKEAFADAFLSLQSANAKEPDHPMTLAMLADLHFVSYALDLGVMEDPLSKGAELIERAVALEPSNQFVIAVLACLQFHRNDRRAFFSSIERALKLHPRSGLRGGGIGFFLCLSGDWERGMALLQKAMRLTPNFPNWFHGPIVLYHYHTRDYASAYGEALKYTMPHNFWGPMLRAATLGLLGRPAEADRSALLELRPDFCERAGTLIRRYVKDEDLVAQLLVGLKRVGLELTESAAASRPTPR